MSVGGVGPGGKDVLAALKDGRVQGDAARLGAATRLLESTFYQEMFEAMRATVHDEGIVSGGAAEDMFNGMLDQQIADAAAMRATRGLGQALYRRFADRLGIEEK